MPRIVGRSLLIGLLLAVQAATANASAARLAECPAFAWSPPVGDAMRVADAAGLEAALAKTQHGGTILLAPGTYGRVDLSNYNPSAEVTIGAADPGDPPVFSGITVEHSSGITLAGLKVQIDGTKAFSINDLDAGLRISDSKRITILASLFAGYVEPARALYTIWDSIREVSNTVDFGGLGRGMGIDATRSDQIEVLGSTFAMLTVGTDFNRVGNVRFAGNVFTGISVDSTGWGGIGGMLFQGNLITNNSVPRGLKHADLMQFRFSTSSRVAIRDNVFVSIRPATHGIYFGGSYFNDYRYDDIVIADNLLVVSGRLSLAVERADGLTITGNRVVANRAAGGGPATILVEESSTAVKVTGNAANLLGASGPGWTDRPIPSGWVWQGNDTLRGAARPPAIEQAPGCSGR